MGGDALPGAGKAQLLLGSGLDADAVNLHTEGRGDLLPHGGNVGSQLGDRTLTDEEVDVAFNAIVESVAKNFGAELRK